MNSRISLRQMRYFVAAAESGSILTASEQIHVSSPSISSAISHIESELQVQLFIRQHAKGLLLTDVGAQLKTRYQQLLGEADAVYTWAAELSGQMRGTLRLGCFAALAPMLYDEVIHAYEAPHDELQMDLIMGNQQKILDLLNTNQLDVALTYDLQIDGHLHHFTPLGQLPPYALLGQVHPLSGAAALHLSELAPHPMVLLDMPYSHDYFLSLFHAQQLSPTIVKSSRYVDIVRTMVANNVGYSLLNVRPKIDQAMDGKPLCAVPLLDALRPMQIGVVTAKNAQPTQLVERFIHHCQTCFADGHIPGMRDL